MDQYVATSVDDRPRILRLLEASGRVAWQFIGVAVTVWILGIVFSRLREVLLAVFVALVLGAVVDPLASRVQRIGLARGVATSLSLLVVVGALGASLTYVGFRLVADLPELAGDIQAQRQPILDLLARPPLSLTEEEVGMVLDRGIEEASRGSGADFVEEVPAVSAEAAEEEADGDGDGEGPGPRLTIAVLRGGLSAARLVGAVLVGVVLAFFLVRDRERITSGVVRHVAGGPFDDRARAAFARGWRALIGYVRGSVLIGLIDAVLIGAALFVLGVPLAGAITVLTFLAAFIPIVGATATGVLAAVITGVSIGPGAGFGMLAWIIVVQQLDGNLLQPVVMQGETNLHPVVTILALTVGGLVGGILGALLAVPIAAVVTNMAASLLEDSLEPPPVVASG